MDVVIKGDSPFIFKLYLMEEIKDFTNEELVQMLATLEEEIAELEYSLNFNDVVHGSYLYYEMTHELEEHKKTKERVLKHMIKRELI